jgi:hypothetical protein
MSRIQERHHRCNRTGSLKLDNCRSSITPATRSISANGMLQQLTTNPGSPHQTSKIVRLGLLRKPVAFRKPIAIPLCNAKCGAFLQVEDRCNNLRLRNSETDSVPLGTRDHNFRGCDSRYSRLSRELLKIRSEME